MKVRIYTLESTLFEGEASEVIARTTTGEISILDNHIALVTTLKQAPLQVVKTGGSTETFDLRGGFLEVRPGSEVVILADSEDTLD